MVVGVVGVCVGVKGLVGGGVVVRVVEFCVGGKIPLVVVWLKVVSLVLREGVGKKGSLVVVSGLVVGRY